MEGRANEIIRMIKPQKLALTLAVLFGGIHALWSILIAIGWAQNLADFSMWAHMVHIPIVIGPFDAMAAITIVVAAAVAGYIVGLVVGEIWNRIHAR